MIKPNKYTNIDLCVLWLSTYILKVMKDERQQKYSQLLEKVINDKGKESRENLLLSLSFLYLLWKIKYYQKEDVIELLTT